MGLRAFLIIISAVIVCTGGCYEQPTLQQREGSLRTATDNALRVTAAQLHQHAVAVQAVRGQAEGVAADGRRVVRVSMASGSGAVLTEDGYILSCAHCVEGSQLYVLLPGETRRLPARVVWMGERASRMADLALIKVEAGGLAPLAWAEERDVVTGTPVAIAGASVPGASGPMTVMAGRITVGLGCELGAMGARMLAVSAPAGKGDSGGPVVTRDGRLIGVTRSGRSKPLLESDLFVLRPDPTHIAQLIEQDRQRAPLALSK